MHIHVVRNSTYIFYTQHPFPLRLSSPPPPPKKEQTNKKQKQKNFRYFKVEFTVVVEGDVTQDNF